MADKSSMEKLQGLRRLEAPPAKEPHRLRLGALLLAEHLITVEQLEDALAEVEESGRRLGEVLLDRAAVTGRDLAVALAHQAGLQFVDLDEVAVDPNAASLLPEKFARRYNALPIEFLSDDLVLVAVADPTDLATSDDLRMALGLNVRFAVVDADALALVIGQIHRRRIEVLEGGGEESEGADAHEPADLRDAAETSAPAIKLVNEIIGRAIDEGASDIHFEPQAKELVVRARVDGVMRQLATVGKAQRPEAVTSRLKIMAGLDIAEKRAPQDGRISVRFNERHVDVRVAVIPTTHGEQIVLRILQRRTGSLGLDDLGMTKANQEIFARSIRQPYGAIIAVGPTGSGKTTTLYAALELLNDPGKVLMTIEDPVEYQIPGVNQIEVNVRAGLTFARGLRTILRSDPDALLVGEIRDEETAHIAMQAAMTGHLLLTTLHTHNAVSSVERLKDMGVPPSLLASSVNCIVAQRLTRRLCVECREQYAPNAEEREELGLSAEDVTLFRSRGCAHCAGTGYRGRVALYEIMPVQGNIRRLIGASTDEIFAAALEQGMTTLRQDGLRAVLEGISTVDEIRRVTGDRLV